MNDDVMECQARGQLWDTLLLLYTTGHINGTFTFFEASGEILSSEITTIGGPNALHTKEDQTTVTKEEEIDDRISSKPNSTP
jgi:hypothetical protein